MYHTCTVMLWRLFALSLGMHTCCRSGLCRESCDLKQRTEQKKCVIVVSPSTLWAHTGCHNNSVEERRGWGVSSVMLIIACYRLSTLAAYGQPPSYFLAIPTLPETSLMYTDSATLIFAFLADRIDVIGYWHHNFVRPSVCDTVHCSALGRCT